MSRINFIEFSTKNVFIILRPVLVLALDEIFYALKAEKDYKKQN